MDKKNYITIENITIAEGAIRFGIKLVNLVKLKSQIEMIFWRLNSQKFGEISTSNLKIWLRAVLALSFSWTNDAISLMFLYEMDEADKTVSLSE